MRPDCDAKVRQDSQTTKTSYKKIAEKIYATPFCQVDYADFNRRTHFSHYPSGTRFCPFLSPLMEFEGVSCYHHSLRLLKCSTIGSCSPSIFRFPRSFLKKRRSFSKKRGRFSKFRWTFSEKRGSFFQPPPREYFSQQIETQIKQKMEELQAWKFNL